MYGHTHTHKVEPRRGETVLTCSLDKTARLTSIASSNCVCVWALPVPLWSCCWDPQVKCGCVL